MLRTLLEKPAPVEDFVEWMDKIVERRIITVRISLWMNLGKEEMFDRWIY
jgi:hypothetical protein